MSPATLFYLLCIPMRLLIVFLAYILLNSASPSFLRYSMIAILTVIGIGFWTIYLKGWRKTGVETGGKPIWWNNLRPIHGSLYLLCALLVISGVKNAWIILLADVLFGFVASLIHNF